MLCSAFLSIEQSIASVVVNVGYFIFKPWNQFFSIILRLSKIKPVDLQICSMEGENQKTDNRLINTIRKMQKQSSSRSLKCLPGRHLAMLCPLFLITILTIVFFSCNLSSPYTTFTTNIADFSHIGRVRSPNSLHSQISHLQTQMGLLLQQLHSETPESKSVAKFSDQVLRIAISLDKLASSLSSESTIAPASDNEMSKVDADFSEPEESDDNQEGFVSLKVFNSGELHNYTSPKPNRQNGKKNFLGVEAISPSIGLACAHMASNIDQFMNYKVFEMCPDDWDLAQKLIAQGCDPLPRRRCFSRSPPHFSKPLLLPMINSSLWTKPSDANILWSRYKCKNYSCLVSKNGTKGFFKCSDCFDLSKRRWHVPRNESTSAEFTIDQVLSLKPAGDPIRIGLDFSPTTGTFAALMRERNVTIASATLNLGAPFNEVIAQRGLLPLYLSIGSRLPFFDNTLDIVHSTLFLDGWIGTELLQFLLFDWDRVLRPKGLLWIDRFFCQKQNMELYLEEFARLGYKKLLWRVAPKTDKLGDELFFSAVLEKPVRT